MTANTALTDDSTEMEDNIHSVVQAFLSSLTELEKQCLRLTRTGGPKKIARRMNLSEEIVKFNLRTAARKLGSNSVAAPMFLSELEEWDNGGLERLQSGVLYRIYNAKTRGVPGDGNPKSWHLSGEASYLQERLEEARIFGYNYPYDVDGEFVGYPVTDEDILKSVEDKLALLDKIFQESPGSPPSEYVRKLFPELTSTVTLGPALPEVAPATWPVDRLPDESPSGFIKRVYEPWLGKGLTKPDVRRLDQPLYQALATWERRHPEDKVDLPTRKSINDSWVERVRSDPKAAAAAKDAVRLANALKNRTRGG